MGGRTDPYDAFDFLVVLTSGGLDPPKPLGGFSEVSGLNMEVRFSEYRDGDETDKIEGLRKFADVTLKRGVVDSSELWAWFAEIATSGPRPRRDVTITLSDESGEPVQLWKLRNPAPVRFAGPTLKETGGGDVAIEELVLSAENIEIVPGP